MSPKVIEVDTVKHFVTIIDIELLLYLNLLIIQVSVTHTTTCSNICIITEKWFKLN